MQNCVWQMTKMFQLFVTIVLHLVDISFTSASENTDGLKVSVVKGCENLAKIRYLTAMWSENSTCFTSNRASRNYFSLGRETRPEQLFRSMFWSSKQCSGFFCFYAHWSPSVRMTVGITDLNKLNLVKFGLVMLEPIF